MIEDDEEVVVEHERCRNRLVAESYKKEKFELKGRLLQSKMRFNFDKIHHLLEKFDQEVDIKVHNG